MKRFFKSLYLYQRFFVALFTLAAGFLFSYWLMWLYPVIWVMALLLFLLLLFDIIALSRTLQVEATRSLPDKFSNSDDNPVTIQIVNSSTFRIFVEVIDELPVQFQKRDFKKYMEIPAKSTVSFRYTLKPVERGEYVFGKLHVFCATPIKLAKRRRSFMEDQMVKVYPSYVQMKKLDFMAIDHKIAQPGLKKIRKIGHTMEFEQIRDYVPGDDVRSINWKATAKQGGLMVNQYQDERSQPVYSIIDTGRAMKMPFENLKLLDYAINSSLAFSNIVIKRKDKAGLVSFSNTLEKLIPASSKKTQLPLILENLYNIDTHFLDSDFGILYSHIKRKLPQRSLLMLYTNFEHLSALHRQLPYLLALAKKHLLVVIFFENTELDQLIHQEAEDIPGIFDQTIAAQFAFDKKLMAKELQKFGIQTVLTKPQELSINTINKYLEIKKRGIL